MSRHKEGDITQIPINTRAVGQPQGAYLLYLEDYVHTFIRKLYQEKTSDNEPQTVALYGYEFEEDGRYYLIVSGAIDKGALAVSSERFFPSCYCIGEAHIIQGRDMQIALEILLPDGKKLLMDNFYIYYDQNEEMQNYLIEWNLTHNRGKVRKESDDTVRFSRVTQSCNREEARVNYLWNAMNLLSLGLMICVLAFGIISVNNYQKMKNMEDKLTYIMSFPADTLAVMSRQVAQSEQMSQNIVPETTEVETVYSSEEETWETSVEQQTQTEVQTQTEEAISEETYQPVQEAVAPATVQYYIVQPGDTLRSISYQIYGDYSMVDMICEWNHIENADSILYGQKLLLHQE